MMPDKVQMTLGKFRAKVAHLPDDTAMIVDMGIAWDFREVSDHLKFFPAAFGLPPALILTTPDTEFRLDEEHMLGERLDEWLEVGENLQPPPRKCTCNYNNMSGGHAGWCPMAVD